MNVKKSIETTRHCILQFNQLCYGGIKVTSDQAQERAVAVITSLSVTNSDFEEFTDMFTKTGVEFSVYTSGKYKILSPKHVACGFKFNEFDAFMELMVL